MASDPRGAGRQRLGRGGLLCVGLALIVVALLQDRTEVALAALVAGVFCSVAALLLPWIREISVNVREGQLSLRTRDPDEVVASALAAEEPSPERDQATRRLAEEERARADARHLVATAAVDRLLHPEDPPLMRCQFRLFMYFDERKRLLPVLDPDQDPHHSEGWAPGQGVTGEAWNQGNYVLATGAACSDSTYGLTPLQQQRYRVLIAVASAPVFNAAGRLIAVLSASTEDPQSDLPTPEAREAHLGLGAAMSRILVDLLRWETDE